MPTATARDARPLEGVKVLDLTRLPPGGYCTVMLADLGADVIRVESTKGRLFDAPLGLNRGKRSVALDLRNPRGLDTLRQLAAWADVLVENDKPGVLDDRGFGYTHAAVEAPRLVWCSITGYGQDGPYAQWGGHDLSFFAHSGLLAGVAGELPFYPQTIVPIPVAGLMATVGILAALRERDATGKGSQIDISISESATWLLSWADGAVGTDLQGVPQGPERWLYPCAEGTWIAVAAAEPASWTALCNALEVADLGPQLFQWDDPAAVIARLQKIFATKSAKEWARLLGPLGASVVPVNRGSELPHDPHVVARRSVQPVGDLLVPRSPVRLRDVDGERPPPPTHPPTPVGVHTRAVLLAAGFDDAAIDELAADGAVLDVWGDL